MTALAGVDAESARLLLAEAQLHRERGGLELARDLVAAAHVHSLLAGHPTPPRDVDTATVRGVVLDVIHPGEEVTVGAVRDRCLLRGRQPSALVVSNELARWTRTGDLTRVARGRYRR